MAEPVFAGAGAENELTNPVGGHVGFKLRGEQSGEKLTVLESVVAAGDGPPLHAHANEDETLYVVDGTVRFRLGDDLHTAHAGALAFVPRGTPHTFQNIGESPARLLIHFTPSGMEQFFEEFAALEVESREAFKELGARVGMSVLGPPMARAR